MGGLFDLDGHVALVTGGNSGIGLGMARGLAGAGAQVAVWGTNAERNAAAVAELEAIGPGAAAFAVDVGDEEQVAEGMAATLDRFGRVDSCFANAGVSGGAPALHQMSLDEWRRVMRVNLDGAFLTLRAALAHMVQRGGGGSVVVTTSGSSVDGAARFEHYAASKAGVNALMRGVAVEYARHGIRANAVLPGWIDTPMTAGGLESAPMREKVLTRVPIRRWGTGDDFAGVAVYLASDASRYHTGDVLVVDGGYLVF